MKSIIIKALSVLAVFALVVLTIESYHAKRSQNDARTVMRLGLEDVVVRVRTASANLRAVRELGDATALSKVRAFTQMIRADRTLIADQSRLNACAKDLDVDELHVSDGRGVLIAGVPTDYIGYSMASTPQSAVFMAALTNKSFALVQEPMRKGIEAGTIHDGKIFQYAGVARLDTPGIVQVGYRAERLEEAMRLADIREIERSSRIGLGGKVTIRPNAKLPPAEDGIVISRAEDGTPVAALERDCDGYRIRVEMPETASGLAASNRAQELVVLDIILVLFLLVLLPGSRASLVREASTFRSLFGSGRIHSVGAFRRALSSPVTLTCAIAFILAAGLAWFVMTRTSMENARARLRAAAQDMRKAVDDSLDNMLIYQGKTIVNHYRTPEAMTGITVKDCLAQYRVDEINAVDSRGIIIVGDTAEIGYDMGSNPSSAAFNCLLSGTETFCQPFRQSVSVTNGPCRKYVGVAFPQPAKGYLQLGFDESRMKHDIDYWFQDAALDRHIGETGYYILAEDETGRILSCGRSRATDLTLAGIGFDVTAAPRAADEFFTMELFGEECLCLSEVRGFHRVISAIPLREVRGGVGRAVVMTVLVLLAVFVIVVIFMTKLTDLVLSLKGYIARDQENRAKDMAVAKTIQTSSLPVDFPDEPNWRLNAWMGTAREVGGDFYDFYTAPDGRRFFVIADVSGKGIPAAMFMMKAKTIIHDSIMGISDFAHSVEVANDMLAENNDANMFVTAWFGLLDPATGVVEYVNAGHNPPLVRRADGSVAWVRGRRSLALAAMGGVTYHTEKLTLGPGDRLFLYTDGVTEAMNTDGELYGESRLEKALSVERADLIATVRRDVSAFVGAAEQSDDITMIAIDFKNTPSSTERN